MPTKAQIWAEIRGGQNLKIGRAKAIAMDAARRGKAPVMRPSAKGVKGRRVVTVAPIDGRGKGGARKHPSMSSKRAYSQDSLDALQERVYLYQTCGGRISPRKNASGKPSMEDGKGLRRVSINRLASAKKSLAGKALPPTPKQMATRWKTSPGASRALTPAQQLKAKGLRQDVLHQGGMVGKKRYVPVGGRSTGGASNAKKVAKFRGSTRSKKDTSTTRVTADRGKGRLSRWRQKPGGHRLVSARKLAAILRNLSKARRVRTGAG